MTATALHAVTRRRRHTVGPSTVRHETTGASAMSASKKMPAGAATAAKYGVPTVTCVPLMAWYSNGKTVPSRTTKAKPTKMMLFATKSPSRDNGWSTPTGVRRASPRQAMRPTPRPTVKKKKVMRTGPSVLEENACTLCNTPERVKKVPRIVKANVAIASDRFQTRKSPRRSCTMTEWI